MVRQSHVTFLNNVDLISSRHVFRTRRHFRSGGITHGTGTPHSVPSTPTCHVHTCTDAVLVLPDMY